MIASVLSFETDQFNRIFPFYILIDSDLKITSLGKSVAKLHPVKAGTLFTECFQLSLPGNEAIAFGSLKQLTNGVVELNFKNSKDNALLGQFEFLDAQNQVLFIGTPRSGSNDENPGLNYLTHRDSIIDQLLSAKKVTEDAHTANEIFLANMSHEIRTPLTGILGIVNLLSKTGLDEDQKKFTKLISESANNLLTIVNDILDVEKIAAGKIDLEYIPFKIEENVFTTLQSFQFKAEDKNINLLLNSTLPGDLVVVGDPHRLSQVLNNLLSNALKFTNEGEISINMDYKKNLAESIIIEIQVQDSGIGIKADKLSEIFKPFTQASSDTTRKFGGTGLGLTICKNLVEMQGGDISVYSKINEGTVFTFNIPYKKGDETMLPNEGKDDINFSDLESIKILVAEDVEVNQFLIKHILESWGCEVTVVDNGTETVKKIRKEQFDLVLMDIQMPDMDGLAATKMIRGLNDREKPVAEKSGVTKKIRTLNARDKSAIPIIALTANALKGDEQRYLELGMNGYISKPYTEEKLFNVINEVVKTNAKLRNKILPKIKNSNGKANRRTAKLYDLSTIESLGKDDDEFIESMITIFIESMPENIDGLIQAGNEKNYEQISVIAHKMKSSIDLFGINPLKYTIRKLENVVPEDTDFNTNIEKVKNTLNEVFERLKELV